MGYRAHVRTKSIIKYDDGWGHFNHLTEELANLIQNYCENAYINDENGYIKDTWEIPRDEFKAMIERIKEDCEDGEEICDDWTKEDVLIIFNEWLKMTSNARNFSYPNLIYIDWF